MTINLANIFLITRLKNILIYYIMHNSTSCSIDDKKNALVLIENTKDDPKIKAEMEKIKTELNQMPCARNPQTGGGWEDYTLTAEQQVTALAWAGRIYTVLKLGGYLYNIVDAYSFQCQAPHWVMGYFNMGDSAYCASKAAIMQETIVQLSILVAGWSVAEGAKKAVTPSGGKRKSRRRKTRKSKKTRKGKKGKKGRKSRRKH